MSQIGNDLVGEAPNLRAATSPEAMAADTHDVTGDGTDLTRALDALDIPTVLLRAERGMLDQPGGLYRDAWLDGWRVRVPRLEVREVEGVNHYSIAMLDRGAAVIAATVRGLDTP